MPAEERFPVMGSTGHVIVAGPDTGLVRRARARLSSLEARWSRFISNSELCRINAAAGERVHVSAETAHLVRRSVQAWRLTGGLFDPSILPSLEEAGYDRSFEQVAPVAHSRVVVLRPASQTPGCDGVEVGDDGVRLARGVRLDLGGIAKGYAADLVAYELRRAGAPGVCVNLGGDVRVSGASADGSGWTIGIADPFDEQADLAAVTLDEGAVATSSRRSRRWRRGTRELHHLIDPRTGEPSQSTLAAVTVVAGETHWAEVFAKSALIAGIDAGAQLLRAHGLSGLLVTSNRDVVRVGSMEVYERWTKSSGGTWRVRAV
jgi:FAD:protein FMN transferase